MSEFATLARPYANALFSISLEESTDFTNSLEAVLQIISNENFKVYSNNPAVSKKLLIEFIYDLISPEESLNLKNFIKVLTENSRLFVLNEILEQYKKLMNASNGIKKAIIVSAFKLDKKGLDSLLNKLENKFKTKIEAVVKVDSSIIGGIRIEIDDQVLDGSIKSKIDRLKSSLLS